MNFKPVFIEANDLDDAWYQLLSALFEHGREYKIDEGSHAGESRLTFDFVAGFIKHPHQGPLAPYVPESGSLSPPTSHEEIEQYFANYLMDGRCAPDEEYRYGTFLVGGDYELPSNSLLMKVPNQVQWVIDHFNKKGLGQEHCYITIGYPESNLAYDIPYTNEGDRRTSPCLRGLDFRVVNNHLTTHVIYRSWDLVGGFPTNMGGFTLLNQYIASEINVEPGPLSFSCKSLHAYSHAYPYIKMRLGK